MASKKIVSLKALEGIVTRAKRTGKTVVSTNGCFDLIHVGHVRNLAKAKSLGDLLIVGVNADATVRKQKGTGRPLFRLNDRMETLAALESIDYVFGFSSDKPHPWLKRLKPNIHVKGGDRGRRISDQDVVEAYGGRVVFTPVHEEKKGTKYATTAIIERLKKL